MRRRACFFVAHALVLSAGCLVPLDYLGVEEIVTEASSLEAPNAIADDRIEDKHPQCDPTLTIEESFYRDRCSFTLDKSCAITKLDILPFEPADQDLARRIYPNYQEAALALIQRDVLPSMEVVNAWMKPFTDGLYAAVELASDAGSDGSSLHRKKLWNDLLNELVLRSSSGTSAEKPLAHEAAVQIAAALRLGGEVPDAPPSVLSEARELESRLLKEPFHAKPIGFYTWTPALEGIFRRDRFLQSPPTIAPTFGAFAATAVALDGSPDLAVRYGQLLDLFAGLTNPYYDRSPRDLQSLAPDSSALSDLSSLQSAFHEAFPETRESQPCRANLAFAPASDSPETRLFRNLYCQDPPSPDTTLIDVLIAKIRAGEIDLTPTAESGFYDRQLYALETLLVPDRAKEKDHIFLTKRYKEKLVETFKTIITQNRETHVKQLGASSTAMSDTSSEVDLYPLLPVEPFPTFFLRTARAYVFLRGLLASTMGDDFLDKASRIVESGLPLGKTLGKPLGEELEERIQILYGLSEIASASIGMRSEMTDEEIGAYAPAQCEERARDWLQGWMWDADIERDPRVIVPMHRDHVTRTIRYWAVVGVQALRMEASFYPGYEPKIVARTCGFKAWVPHDSFLLVGKQVEVTLPESVPPPTRKELREICDKHDNVADIVKAIEAG